MVDRKYKLAWQKPKIIFELPFEKTAAGLVGEGADGDYPGFTES